MDNSTLKKYFKIDDYVEISVQHDSLVGKIVDFSDYAIVIEDNTGNPVVISLNNIQTCKHYSNSNVIVTENEIPSSEDGTDYANLSIQYAINQFDTIYRTCSINTNETIKTNAQVVNLSADGVEVITDDNLNVTCIKSCFVGYSRENASIGKRVYCKPDKDGRSFVTIADMSYAELYERFVRAINIKPIPRCNAIWSMLNYLKAEYGNIIQVERKNIKRVLNTFEHSKQDIVYSSRVKLDDLTIEQIGKIKELIVSNIEDIIPLEGNDQIKFVDNLIASTLSFKIRRIAVKTILSEFIQDENIKSDNVVIMADATSKEVNNDDDHYFDATCEIVKYYPQFSNGTIKDGTNDGIRFKDEIIIDEELKSKVYNCWNSPIPVICSYKMVGKWNVASFVTLPGSLNELRSKVIALRSSGKPDLADSLSDYIETEIKKNTTGIEIDLNINSQELLLITRRQRLIKNFAQAEKGFLELIAREYEFDVVVRDLAAMYQECDGPQKAIDTLIMYLPLLEEKVKTYNQLSLLYQSIGNKEKAIEVMINSLALIPPTTKANQKKIAKLEKRIAFLKKTPLSNSKEKGVSTPMDMQFDIEIPSELIRYDASNISNNVLAYVKDKSIEEKLAYVSSRIGELKDSPELPDYYLTKVHLIESTGESSSSELIKNLLADYCRAKARNYFNEGNLISAREYLLEGICLCEREDLYYLLFLSLCTKSIQEILSNYNMQYKSYEEISIKYKNLIEETDTFYVLLRILAQDCKSSRRLLKTIYNSESIEWIIEELDLDNKDTEAFVIKISRESQKCKNIAILFENALDSLISINNAVELSNQILNSQIPTLNEISTIDHVNVANVIEIANLVIDFSKNVGYEECDEIARNAYQKIDTGISIIQKQPTHLSTLRILPILLKFKDLMDKLFNKKYTETRPNIVVNAIDDARPIGDDIEIQISISNEAGFQRANNCILTIDSINGKDISNMLLKNSYDTPLTGGTVLTSGFTIKSSILDNDEINLSYTLSYSDARKFVLHKQGNLSLVINRGNDYEDFENPYIKHVKSNAVKDKSMFKGREEIIGNICRYVLEDYKGYVLYGQKRSGKSSVLYHITQRLRDEHKAFAVEYTMGNNIVQDSETEKDTLANLFYTIISEIGRAIKEVDRNVYRESGCRIIRRQEFESYPEETFREYLDMYREIIQEKLHYEQDKIVLIVDEFTYLYYHILEGKISSGIMEFWKGLLESKVFSFVFAGQDAMPRFMDQFQNVFASMHPQELTYIDEVSARELIEEPIWDSQKNISRYTPDAVNEIINLTSCSPFYIMILCSELVKDARRRKRLPIHISDVKMLVQKMVCNESSISRKDFDNLISCGESRLDLIDKEDSISVLKNIANISRNGVYCDVNAITTFNDKEKVRSVIEDLLHRRVLERHPEFGGKVKIKVGLFKSWLLNHES